MIYLLTGYVLALITPLFMASWRIAIWAFAVQSLVTALLLVRGEEFDSWTTRMQALDLIVFRSLIIPFCLISILKKFRTQREFDTIPANFVVWTMALALLIAGFWFGQTIFQTDFQSAIRLGTATAGCLTGLFVLANQSSPIGQVIGLLTLEAGIILTETLATHHERLLIQFGLSAIFIWSIWTIVTFFRHFSKLEVSVLESPQALQQEEKDVL
ncbi:hypothetical protein WDW86_11405 [Bdellovibrionota bacterium FG-2]